MNIDNKYIELKAENERLKVENETLKAENERYFDDALWSDLKYLELQKDNKRIKHQILERIILNMSNVKSAPEIVKEIINSITLEIIEPAGKS